MHCSVFPENNLVAWATEQLRLGWGLLALVASNPGRCSANFHGLHDPQVKDN